MMRTTEGTLTIAFVLLLNGHVDEEAAREEGQLHALLAILSCPFTWSGDTKIAVIQEVTGKLAMMEGQNINALRRSA
jgi:hypothetical protein